MKNLVIALSMFMLAGCMSFSDRPMRPIRNAILEQNPEITLEKEIAINIGAGMFNFLGAIDFDDSSLSEIDSVQMAVYKVHGQDADKNFTSQTFQDALLEKDASLYWEQIVRVRDDGENVWVFAGMDLVRNNLEAISVFVMEHDELVLISVDGDIEKLMRYALESAHGRRDGTHTG
jgi:hypothetical protein